MSPQVLLELFGHCALLSLLAIGGAIATAPDLHRLVVVQRGWITDVEFSASLALAQAAPGPNLLFVAVVGYNVAGLAGALAALLGMLLPSTVLTLVVFRWGSRRRDSRGVKAFVAGMAPVTLGLVVATATLLARPMVGRPVGLALVLASGWLMWRSKVNPLWLILAGALAGAAGLV